MSHHQNGCNLSERNFSIFCFIFRRQLKDFAGGFSFDRMPLFTDKPIKSGSENYLLPQGGLENTATAHKRFVNSIPHSDRRMRVLDLIQI